VVRNRSPSPAEPGWHPLGWPLGRSPDPLALAGASALVLLFSATMSLFNCLKTVGGSSARKALRKPSSSSVTIYSSMYPSPKTESSVISRSPAF
jgi:hypothetical protein